MADDNGVKTANAWTPERRAAHGELVRKRMAAKKRSAGRAGAKKATTNGSAGPVIGTVDAGLVVNGKTISFIDAMAVHAAIEKLRQQVKP